MKRPELTEKIRSWIHSERFQRGALLPSERELAAELQVSRPTLRRALEPLVHEGLLERQAGRGLIVPENDGARQDWRVLALILPDIANRFFSEVAEAVEYTALQRGYQVLLCNSRHQPHLEEFHIRQIITHRVKGVILAHDPNQDLAPSLGLLQNARIPVVLLFSTALEVDCDSIVLDERAGVEQAIRYLASLGHRRIAFCRPLPGPRPHPREVHFRDYVGRSSTLSGDCILDLVGKEDHDIQRALSDMLSREDPPTACLAGNDNVALMVMTNLAALNVRVPEAFSVVGFDNLRFVQHLPVPLTTIDQPKLEMGRRAAELLLERIDAPSRLAPRNEVFTPHLVIRDSCSVAPVPERIYAS